MIDAYSKRRVVAGLAVNDRLLMLTGALPAAVLALGCRRCSPRPGAFVPVIGLDRRTRAN